MADTEETRNSETEMVRAARENAIALQETIAGLLALSDRLTKLALQELDRQERQGVLDLMGVMRLFSTIATVSRQANDIAMTAMRMERMLDHRAGFEVEVPEMTLEEAAQQIELANRALQRARDRGYV